MINYTHRTIKIIQSGCFGIFLSLTTFVHAVSYGSWNPNPAAPIGGLDFFTTSDAIVSSCYDSKNNRLFASWPDQATGYPMYSIYSEGNWSTPIPIDDELGPCVGDISICYNTHTDQVFAAWIGESGNQPMVSTLTAGLWSSQTLTSLPCSSPTMYYDGVNNRVSIALLDEDGHPVIAFYDSVHFTDVCAISSEMFVYDAVYTCSNGNTLIAVWADRETREPIYSVYNSALRSWSTPVPIATTHTVTDNLYLSYNHKNNQVIATWGALNKNSRPFYATLSGLIWSAPKAFDTTATVSQNVFTAYDSSEDNQSFSAWANKKNHLLPTFSIFRNSTWYPDFEIDPEDPVDTTSDTFLTYNSGDDEVLATWRNTSNNVPMYSIYRYCGARVLPPMDLAGRKHRCDSGTIKEWCNTLEWDSSPSPEVVAYTVYRNGALISTVSIRSHHYVDHDQPKGIQVEYSVYAVDGNGDVSLPATIVID